MLYANLALAFAGQVAFTTAFPQFHQAGPVWPSNPYKNKPGFLSSPFSGQIWHQPWWQSSSSPATGMAGPHGIGMAPSATGVKPKPSSPLTWPIPGEQGPSDQDSDGQETGGQDSDDADDEFNPRISSVAASTVRTSALGIPTSRPTTVGSPSGVTITSATLTKAPLSQSPASTSSTTFPGQMPSAISETGKIWQPAVLTPFQMILSAPLDIDPKSPSVTPDVEVYDIDLFDNDKTSIESLHKLGKKVICYFSAGTSETWRPDYSSFKSSDEGAGLPDWPGEKWLDVRNPSVLNVMKQRIKMASDKGCDAVDPDNMDGYGNQNGGGFKNPLTQQDSITYMRQLAKEASSHGMAIGLKNAQEILGSVTSDIQFAVNEECATDGSCGTYNDFTTGRNGQAGKPVFHVEYVSHTGSSSSRLRSRASNTEAAAPPNPADFDASVSISSTSLPALDSIKLRNTLCLQDGSSKSSGKLSTAIKELNLSGWVMDCSGRVQSTKTKASKSSGKYSSRI